MTAPEGNDMSDQSETVEVVVEDAAPRRIDVRDVLERQLGAGQSLGRRLVGASTDVSVALAHAPASVVDEIRGGATLPAALGHAGTEVRGIVANAGTRVRTAIGDYVGSQATLPNAVIVGTADVAEAVLRAQGNVTASAIDSVFTVATVAARGGTVRDTVVRERRDVAATADVARNDIAGSWARASEEIRGAVDA
jgi:hypothetical protein